MEQQRERQGYPPLPPLPALALILFQKEIAPPIGPPLGPPRVGLATLAPGGAQVLFVLCQAEEWSCHISSDFSACGPLSESDHGPRVSFSVLVDHLGLREAFFLNSRGTFSFGGGTLGFNCSFIYRAVFFSNSSAIFS